MKYFLSIFSQFGLSGFGIISAAKSTNEWAQFGYLCLFSFCLTVGIFYVIEYYKAIKHEN